MSKPLHDLRLARQLLQRCSGDVNTSLALATTIRKLLETARSAELKPGGQLLLNSTVFAWVPLMVRETAAELRKTLCEEKVGDTVTKALSELNVYLESLTP